MTAPSGLRARAALLDELRQIVQAMKNIAFVELQRVARVRPAQQQAAQAVMQALRTLPADPQAAAEAAGASRKGAIAWLVVGAERGFCGAFNARLAHAVSELREQQPTARVLVASHRVLDLLAEAGQGGGVVGLPGCAAAEEADAVLDEWLAAIARHASDCRELWLLHTADSGLARLRLWPEPESPAQPSGARARQAARPSPGHHLPIPVLRGALRQQALRLVLQGGLYASLEQENHWRLMQMQRAQDHLDELGKTLQRRYAALRQADITNELETLVSSLDGRA